MVSDESNKVIFAEEYITNKREMMLFTCSWLPADQDPKALVFLLAGYGLESSITMNETGVWLAKAGFAAYGMDYEGQGKSAGLIGYIRTFDGILNDCCDHLTNVCERMENKGKPRFILGDGVGGTLVLLLSLKMANFWDGAITIAPLCKLKDELLPPSAFYGVWIKLGKTIPKWKIGQKGKDFINMAFHDPEKRKEIRANPYSYTGRLRAKSACEIFLAGELAHKKFHEISVPILALHGGKDRLESPYVSAKLFEQVTSKDKTFTMYPEMWHSLNYGEMPENIKVVLTDVVAWLEPRCDLNYHRESAEKNHMATPITEVKETGDAGMSEWKKHSITIATPFARAISSCQCLGTGNAQLTQ